MLSVGVKPHAWSAPALTDVNRTIDTVISELALLRRPAVAVTVAIPGPMAVMMALVFAKL
jgi:hypothetical protein